MPSWQSSVVNWRSGDPARCAARRSASPVSNAWRSRARQHEVVGPEAVAASRSCVAYRSWTSGSTTRPSDVGDVGHPLEELVDLGLDHEAGRARLLDDVADGVEPDDPDAVRREEAQPAGDRARASPATRRRGRSARTSRRSRTRSRPSPARPVARSSRSRTARWACAGRSARRPRRRVAVGPDLVEGDEQVGDGGLATVPLEVPELRALPRDVVDHQVEQHVVVARRCRSMSAQVPNRGSISS